MSDNNKYTSKLYRTYVKVLNSLSNIHWTKIKAKLTGGPGYNLTNENHERLKELLAKDYYIILTRRKSYLSTYMIGIGSLITTGKYSKWSHVLMNMEGDDPVADEDFILVEATGNGVHPSSFMEVFNCDWVALLKPKHVSLSEFTKQLDAMLIREQGKPYDNLFDLADDSHLSCVELVRLALMGAIPNYHEKFAQFEKKICKKKGVLTPQMFADCEDFEIVLEIRR